MVALLALVALVVPHTAVAPPVAATLLTGSGEPAAACDVRERSVSRPQRRPTAAPSRAMRPVAPLGRRALFRGATSRGGEQILVGLYQSSQPKVGSGTMLRDAGIDVVVDMNSASPLRGGGPGGGIRYYSYPVRDDRPTKEEWRRINAAADLVAKLVRQGKSVLVNCAVGRNRSATVNALALVRLGHSPEDAIRLVRRNTSPTSIRNPYFERGILTGSPWG